MNTKASIMLRNSFNYNEAKITKPRRTPSPTKEYKKVELTEDEIRRYYKSPQPVAAVLLGVSLSSLKRRYYQLARKDAQSQCKRWPYQSLTMMERKQSVYFVLNSRIPDECTTLDHETIVALQKAFKCN